MSVKVKYRVNYQIQPSFKYGHKDFTDLAEGHTFLCEHPLIVLPIWLIELRGGRRHRIIECPICPELNGQEFCRLVEIGNEVYEYVVGIANIRILEKEVQDAQSN